MFFRCLSGLLVLACAGTCAVLRVCADPQNLPFSNQAREGLDNRVAEIVANGLDATLEFVWWPERKASVAQFLDAGNCDVWFGAPSGLPSALTTKPYYRSSYVFISRRDRVGSISSLFDERFSSLRIGAQIVGDDYAPPALVLARRGLSAHLAGFSLFGPEGEPNPAARIVEAVDTGAVDVAIVWGPVAGYFAKRAKSPLEITSV
ncbi:MAG TPA: hypothetical protein VKX49_28355, partial [Bryobacteraceae bacterium]|nr:hypothetical protein [Bryobacteraceae bacterium]